MFPAEQFLRVRAGLSVQLLVDRPVVATAAAGTTSIAVSCGGVANPPSTPAWSRGSRVPSRNFSQLALESWTARMVQPPAKDPPRGRPGPGASCHRLDARRRSMLRTAPSSRPENDGRFRTPWQSSPYSAVRVPIAARNGRGPRCSRSLQRDLHSPDRSPRTVEGLGRRHKGRLAK